MIIIMKKSMNQLKEVESSQPIITYTSKSSEDPFVPFDIVGLWDEVHPIDLSQQTSLNQGC